MALDERAVAMSLLAETPATRGLSETQHPVGNRWMGWRAVKRCAILALGLAAAGSAWAQYPSRPVRLIVPIPPGGAPDIAARIVGQKLAEALGQPVVIENKVGSNGNISAEYVAKSPPDGYTLLLAADSQFVINPFIYRQMPIDVMRDLVPVSTLVSNMFVLSVNPSLPVKTFPEFIEYAKRASPPLAYASGGNGSQHHLMMEQLKHRAGIELVHVPYKGGAPATTATVAGEVAVMFAGTSTAPQIRAGKLRALAVTGAKRSEAFPEVPAIGEFYPGYEATIWLGLFAPAGTPEPVLTRLRQEVAKVLAAPDVVEKLNAAGGLQPFVLPPAELAAMMQRDAARYREIIQRVGAQID